jgi:hypothetical protein
MTGKWLGLLVCLCLLTQTEIFAQNRDSIPAQKPAEQEVSEGGMVKDSTRLADEARPRIAARRSAIFPGLGQIYNKRWWKVPLVYGGFVGIGLVYEFNQRYYKTFLREAQYRQEAPEKANPAWAPYSDEGIIGIKDDYRRSRDLSILAGVAFYAVQIIDAYVDAKFFKFDVSNDLSLKVDPLIQPGMIYNAHTPPAPALGFRVKLSL